jgi:hypothetical protein
MGMKIGRVRIHCPKCASSDVRRSGRRGWLDKLLKDIYIKPFRCLYCGARFYRSSLTHKLDTPNEAGGVSLGGRHAELKETAQDCRL